MDSWWDAADLLVENIWHGIADEAIEDPGRLPVPEAQLQEIRRRWETYLQNPDDVVPFDEALERIERSLE